MRIGWELADIAARLRIRLPYLIAIEDGQIGDLPGAAYAVGFVRTYATALGLDPDEMARRFREEAAEVNDVTELDFPVPVPERGVPAGAVVLLGVMLAVIAYIGWYRLSGDGTLPPEVVPAVPERLAPLAQLAEPPPSANPLAATAPPPAAPPPPVLDQAQVSVPPNQAAAMPIRPLDHAVTASDPASPSQAAAAASGAAAADEGRIVLRAKSDSWVLVRDPKGSVLFTKVLHAGESWTVPDKPGLTLTTGNAGGTEVLVDGVVAPALGASGVVRRDVPLDADAIKAGKLPVQQAAATPSPAAPASQPAKPPTSPP